MDHPAHTGSGILGSRSAAAHPARRCVRRRQPVDGDGAAHRGRAQLVSPAVGRAAIDRVRPRCHLAGPPLRSGRRGLGPNRGGAGICRGGNPLHSVGPAPAPPTTMTWRHIVTEVRRGRSVGRALMHKQVQADVVARGIVLDGGGGHRQSYLEFLDVVAADRLVSVDIRPTPDLSVAGSVTLLPFKSASVDTVLCFNLLEHVFDHDAALREMRRVMKPGALLYGWTPFSIGVHGDPSDYWRYTPDALEELLRLAGFVPVRVTGCG
ncbi:MAG: methyltransferase domain-containing protein, partial [Acidobacteria bacterium]|nr:methyltransferase domain-containing protein [Acidobacteriota bacterium]